MVHHQSEASMSPSSETESIRVSGLSGSPTPRSQIDLVCARPDEAPNYIGIP